MRGLQLTYAGLLVLLGVFLSGLGAVIVALGVGFDAVQQFDFPQELFLGKIAGALVGGAVALFGVGFAATGYGLFHRDASARIGGICVGGVLLLVFPLGTVLGLLGLWALLSERGQAAFARRPPKREDEPMTEYPSGHKGYGGRMRGVPGQEGDDGFVDFHEEGKGRRMGCALVAVGIVGVALFGAGVLVSTNALSDSPLDVKKWFEQAATAVSADDDEDDALRVRREDLLDELPSDAVGTTRPRRKGPIVERSLEEVAHEAVTDTPTAEEQAGTFQYIDDKGVLHIVDDFGEVPKRYRKKATKLKL